MVARQQAALREAYNKSKSLTITIMQQTGQFEKLLSYSKHLKQLHRLQSQVISAMWQAVEVTPEGRFNSMTQVSVLLNQLLGSILFAGPVFWQPQQQGRSKQLQALNGGNLE